jgi:hypothetical protein
MRISARPCTFTLFALTLLGSGTARGSLILNGGFDNNSNGWTVSPVSVNNLWRATGGNPGGNQRLNASGSPASDPYIEQTIAGLQPGATYLVSWDLIQDFTFLTGPSFGVFLDPTDAGVSPNGGVLFLFTYGGLTGWMSQQTAFVATANSHTLRFAAELDARTPGVTSTTDSSYYIDNVAMVLQSMPAEVVPEPAAWLLLAGGLVCLRRRCGRIQ